MVLILKRFCMEIYDVVDEDDKVIGKTTRQEIHDKRLIHRSVMFFIFDKKGRIFVTQRTKNKEFYKEYWSIVLGGHINSGETYEEAAIRECKEETGIESKPVFMRFFKQRIPEEKENVKVFAFYTDKIPKIDPFEIKQGKFMTMKELENKLKNEKFLPETNDLLKILKNFKK